MNRRSVSVLLPIWRPDYRFRDVDWLCGAISSVSVQGPAVAEIVVFVDGPGSMGFWAAAKANLSQQSLSACRCIFSPSNVGLSRALNWCLAASRNELIARIDQDDLWGEGKLDLQCAALEADQDLALSFTSMEWTDENGRPIAAYDRGMSWPETIDFCQHIGCPIPHPSIVVRRDVILALGGYPESSLTYACEDFLLWASLIRFFKAEGLSDCLLQYRQHPVSISSSRRESQAAATSRIMADLKRLGDSIDYVDAFVTSALSLGKTRFEFGLYLLEVWRFDGELSVPTGCVERIRSIFYDRCVNVIERGPNHALVAVSRL